MMTVPDKLFAKLLARCPQAEPDLIVECEEYPDLPYVQIAVFARQLISSYKQSDTEYFPSFFQIVEELLDGDDEQRNLLIVGLLESIQTNASWEVFGPKVFEEWLGPKTLREWRGLAEQWDSRSSLADILRDEQQRQ